MPLVEGRQRQSLGKAPPRERDLALLRPAEASSIKSAERLAGNAVDGNPETRWTSRYEDEQWISVDLGRVYLLSRVEVRWETAYAQTYELKASLDGKIWTTLATVRGRAGWVITALPPQCRARWVRVHGNERATRFGFSIYDLRVFEVVHGDAGAKEDMAHSSVPPQPLTVTWISTHGDLAGSLKSVREEELPLAENSGMASVCTLLWVKTGRSAVEEAYVAKRSRGAKSRDDLGALEREMRFYTEVLKLEDLLTNRSVSAPEAGDRPMKRALFLGGALRVPQCMAASFLPAGHDAGQRADSFLLVLERFAAPAWVPWEERRGCSDEQALTAVETLARLHAAFTDESRMKALAWLPLTTMNAGTGNAAMVQFHFMTTWGSSSGLEELLTPCAARACERLSVGGFMDVLARIVKPPLTLLHGDFKPENLRFAGPGHPAAVAAFDWGMVCRGRGAFDFAYFAALSGPPATRRVRDKLLLQRYREAFREACKDSCEHLMEDFENDVKAACCLIMCIIILTLSSAVFHSKRTEQMLRRSLQWVGEALSDWHAGEVL